MGNKTIKVECNKCGCPIDIEFNSSDLSWEVVETDDDRGMGTEYHHEAVIEHECDVCDETITVTLGVWEYPEGSFNSQEIEVDGGDLISGCDLADIAPIGDLPDESVEDE